jgi:hypothetical protein
MDSTRRDGESLGDKTRAESFWKTGQPHVKGKEEGGTEWSEIGDKLVARSDGCYCRGH